MKLISMTDFVLQCNNKWHNDKISTAEMCKKITSYANFLKQPLTLGMFVPCDDDGNVLEEPICENQNKSQQLMEFAVKSKIFDKAQSKVLFTDFNIRKQSSYAVVFNKDGDVWITWNESKAIETLIYLNLDLAIFF